MQFTRLTSVDTKFVLDSESVAVTAIAPLTGSGAPLVSAIVGRVKSAVRDSVFDAKFEFAVASVNVSAATVALKSPSVSGVSVKE